MEGCMGWGWAALAVAPEPDQVAVSYAEACSCAAGLPQGAGRNQPRLSPQIMCPSLGSCAPELRASSLPLSKCFVLQDGNSQGFKKRGELTDQACISEHSLRMADAVFPQRIRGSALLDVVPVTGLCL